MTNERVKSIAILSATLLVGILIGLMLSGLYRNLGSRGRHGGPPPREQKSGSGKDRFVGALFRVIKPDSSQREKITPIVEWASVQMDSIERTANTDAARIMDSVKLQLRPIITAEQFDRLEKFNQVVGERWRHGNRGHQGPR